MVWPFSQTIQGTATSSYEALYNAVQSGPGPGGLSQAVGDYQALIRADFDNASNALSIALTNAGAVWEGDAADQMQSGVKPHGKFAEHAAHAAAEMAKSVQTEADAFAETRRRMPPPQPATATDSALERGLAALTGTQTDLQRQEAEQAAVEDQGRGIYDGYDNGSSGNTGGIGGFPAPPNTIIGGGTGGASHVEVTPPSGPVATGSQSGGVVGTAGVVAPPPGVSGGGFVPPGGGGALPGATPGPGLGSGGELRPGPATSAVPPSPGAAASGGAAGVGAGPRGGAGGLVPAPVPLGGRSGDDSSGSRWRRQTGPGLFDNDPRGTRNGAGVVPGGRDGSGAGAGARGMGLSPEQTGRSTAGGGAAGVAAGAGAAARTGAGGVAGGAGGRAQREEDEEYARPDFLVETDDVFGDAYRVAPAVIGGEDTDGQVR